ncbi:hypothetical protein BDW68DRAFT_16627 [Aspergillus falconensis]
MALFICSARSLAQNRLAIVSFFLAVLNIFWFSLLCWRLTFFPCTLVSSPGVDHDSWRLFLLIFPCPCTYELLCLACLSLYISCLSSSSFSQKPLLFQLRFPGSSDSPC